MDAKQLYIHTTILIDITKLVTLIIEINLNMNSENSILNNKIAI